MKGYLVLEDGTVCDGVLFGFLEDRIGEVVFSTGMTGYQESLTDPSYCGQILVSSYPLIGNYGTNLQDNQSNAVQVWGYVVREQSRFPSHRDCAQTIDEFLRASKVPGISGIDTRSLIRKLRDVGTMMGGITAGDPAAMLEKVKKSRNPDQTNLVASVSTDKTVRFDEKKSKTVAVFDCGVKESILVELRKRFNVIQLPFDAKPETVRGFEPDGIFITNGPGNPAHPEMLSTTVSTLAKLKEEYPMMGICLGNQLISLMFGAKTYKLKFGHRGINQPVKFEGRVLITSQNHGFAVDRESAENAELEVCFINLNDLTVEGIRHKELRFSRYSSIQKHMPGQAIPDSYSIDSRLCWREIDAEKG